MRRLTWTVPRRTFSRMSCSSAGSTMVWESLILALSLKCRLLTVRSSTAMVHRGSCSRASPNPVMLRSKAASQFELRRGFSQWSHRSPTFGPGEFQK